jgi:DNA-binding transcriptional MerR regulator
MSSGPTVAPELGDSPDAEDSGRSIRIGEVAELTGVTPRTIRYYEEIGLLGGEADRAQGKHRCYTQTDVDRISEIVRLKELLGLTLEQLSQLLEAETARTALRKELQATDNPEDRKRILQQLLGHIETQLALVQRRHRELEQLERELLDKTALVRTRLSELG